MSLASEIAAGVEESDLHLGQSLRSEDIRNPVAEITLAQKMISACSGSLITSLVVTPFDVIRIRIQQQEILQNYPCCETHFPSGGNALNTLLKEQKFPVASSSPELFWLHQNYCKSAENCTRITSTFQGFASISRNEGLATLWRGLSITLLMAIPSNIIYFTGYEYIRDHSSVKSHPLNPLVCGSFARIMAATFVSPLELVKTRLQSVPTDSKPNANLLFNLLRDSARLVQQRGIGTLFTGLQITLWRDVPFSGIYWSSYEFFKSRISNYLQIDFENKGDLKEDDWKVFTTSFLSGSISGMIGAFFTNPFDVGKTRLQITSQNDTSVGKKTRKPSMFSFLKTIYMNEGVGALYSGFVPRVIKIAPSCAIMISSYEIGKKFFKTGNTMD